MIKQIELILKNDSERLCKHQQQFKHQHQQQQQQHLTNLAHNQPNLHPSKFSANTKPKNVIPKNLLITNKKCH